MTNVRKKFPKSRGEIYLKSTPVPRQGAWHSCICRGDRRPKLLGAIRILLTTGLCFKKNASTTMSSHRSLFRPSLQTSGSSTTDHDVSGTTKLESPNHQTTPIPTAKKPFCDERPFYWPKSLPAKTEKRMSSRGKFGHSQVRIMLALNPAVNTPEKFRQFVKTSWGRCYGAYYRCPAAATHRKSSLVCSSSCC